MSTLTDKIKHEFMKAFPPTIFFFIILHIVAIVCVLTIRGPSISLPTSTSVLIALLILDIEIGSESLLWDGP